MKDNNKESDILIAGYQVIEELGEGSSGKVYKVYDPKLERFVALKLLNKNLSKSVKHKELFQREIKLQAKLSIPGIIRVYDCGDVDNQLYYTMELIEGTTIDKYCRNKRLTAPEIIALIASVADTVAALHHRDVIHRDIKPRNIMIDEHGNSKLLDLGVAALVREDAIFVEQFGLSGSPGYLAPENFNDPKASMTVAADIYALGVTTYELVSGELPYELDFLSLEEIGLVINNEQPRPLKLPKSQKLSGHITDTISQAMNIAPETRPSAEEFALALRREPKGISRQLKTVAGIGIVLLAAGAAAGSFYAKMDRQESGKPQPKPVINKINNGKTETRQPPVPLKKGPFYFDMAPKHLREEWRKIKAETGKGRSALMLVIPENSYLKVFRENSTVFTMDARFERKGCIYRPVGDRLTIKYYEDYPGSEKVFTWVSENGKTDIFEP